MRYDKTLRVRLTKDQFTILDEHAKKNEKDMSQIIRDFIDTLEKKERREKMLEMKFGIYAIKKDDETIYEVQLASTLPEMSTIMTKISANIASHHHVESDSVTLYHDSAFNSEKEAWEHLLDNMDDTIADKTRSLIEVEGKTPMEIGVKQLVKEQHYSVRFGGVTYVVVPNGIAPFHTKIDMISMER